MYCFSFVYILKRRKIESLKKECELELKGRFTISIVVFVQNDCFFELFHQLFVWIGLALRSLILACWSLSLTSTSGLESVSSVCTASVWLYKLTCTRFDLGESETALLIVVVVSRGGGGGFGGHLLFLLPCLMADGGVFGAGTGGALGSKGLRFCKVLINVYHYTF